MTLMIIVKKVAETDTKKEFLKNKPNCVLWSTRVKFTKVKLPINLGGQEKRSDSSLKLEKTVQTIGET